MSKKTTIYDIAKKLNITAATVSRALNGNPKISESTRQLVNETAKEMNYEQNKLAQALKSGKSYNVGVIVPRIDSNFFALVIRGIEEVLYAKGYHVIICQTHDQKKLEIQNINSLLNAQVDGVLMSISNSGSEENENFDRLLKKNVPLIFFDRKKDIDGISAVTIDDFKAGYEAAQHLINQGCKRIAHLSNNRKIQIFNNRYLGYKQAILDNGLEFDESLVIETASKVEEGSKATKILLDMEMPPDAIFSSSDFAALGAIQEIKSRGIRIPQDICIVGFANEPFTRFMELPVTSVDQSPLEMGRISAQVFLDEVDKGKKKIPNKQVVLNPELIIRKSSLKSEA
ncbi:LacI family transcriptional regulator [Algibacter amylolyticus]|uniref:LacI family transcriptional regulator n=1 Tax=Algibacter amylolyticus TaxID=1608400 RepID=A0A5M7BGH1_9FLAO|nr:LacI family DNA-binding transcriptional regulator [Algibacter amylolyticus]KAA5827993.1 LacI family transcriptional regulator [Algibacter amylolyticus]MBB5267235.1 LacI family transcriptional regulator [Algibacter amylolyticus]TSJ82238.1 LacI family transcriptional regulator [Algibacter amylolyticus]